MLLLSLLLAAVVACKQETAKNDADTVTADDDAPYMEGDIITGDDTVVPNDETIDEVLSDNDAINCPDLKVYENVKAAGFPLKDGNGKTTFCRPGCDTPTENDPQCVRNLWEWINWRHYQDYLAGKNTLGGDYNYKECYPWPCVLPDLKSTPISYSSCDRSLVSNNLQADSGTVFDLRIENGFVGGSMLNGGINTRTLMYDVSKDEFISIASSGGAVGHHSGRLIFYSTLHDVMLYPDEGFGNMYVFSAKKSENGYRYEVIYDDADHQSHFQRPPLVGEKWVVLNILHWATKIIEVVYSKVDEWEWHPLKRGKVYEGNIVGDRLTFIDDWRGVYVCDLDKLPFDPDKECLRIDREGETAYQPRLNEENNQQMVYHDASGGDYITLVDLSGEKPAYTLLPFIPSESQSLGGYPHQFKGQLILYDEMFTPLNDTRADYKACFYRVDLKKNYCPTKHVDPIALRYNMGFNSFDGSYQTWKTPSGTMSYIRDMDCYCKQEGLCPHESTLKIKKNLGEGG